MCTLERRAHSNADTKSYPVYHENLTYMCCSTLEIGTAQLRSVTEITLIPKWLIPIQVQLIIPGILALRLELVFKRFAKNLSFMSDVNSCQSTQSGINEMFFYIQIFIKNAMIP